ncbi:MAG: hypothetical protein JWO15_2238 [Sphingomonadales bacterium]|nr:hypothetical protein [Sphingomonadales bacterium]
MKVTMKIRLATTCSIAGLLVTAPAWGQTAEAAQPAQASTTDVNDDIVVTATKREQSLSDVGLSIAAVSGNALTTQRVSNVADLAQIVPGLTFAPTLTAAPVYNLRGVGFYDSSLSSYPDVSLYIDQVPLSLPIMSTLTAFDLERVEVLKGPQGTLFGNNATGGAINFIAAKPTSTFSAGVQFGYSRFNTFDVDAFVSGPITDTLSARFAVKAVSGDDWQRSYTRNDTLGKQKNIAGRFLLDWKPVETLRFSLNINGWRDQNDPIAPQKIATTEQNVPGTTGLGGTLPLNFPIYSFPNAPHNARDTDWSPQYRPYADNKFAQIALRTDADITDDITLTSLSSYSGVNFRNATDTDGTPYVNQNTARLTARIRSFTQELRLSNSPKNPLRWVVGANYERTTAFEAGENLYWDASTAPINGISASHYEGDHRMLNYAAFGNVEYDVNDRFTLKGGIRQTRAQHRSIAFNGNSPIYDPQTPFTLTQFFNQIYGLIYGSAVPTIADNGSIILDTRTNADGTPVDPTTYLKAGRPTGEIKENSTSWSAGVDFKPVNGILLYANIAKGYKAGSYPTLAGSVYTAYEPVKQESILSYEVGAKLELLDRKLFVNATGFYYDYSNKQQKAKFVDPIFGGLDRLLNVPKSTIKGAELEVTARPFHGLSLSASGTYLDAKVKQFEGIVGSVLNGQGLLEPVTASFKGVRLPFAPKLQYAIRADYGFPVSDTLAAFVGGGVNGQSKSIGILTLSAVDRALYEINGRALVNLNAGLRSADDRWRLSVWGKNVFNKYYWTQSIQSYDTVVRYPGRPAEYGATLGVRF